MKCAFIINVNMYKKNWASFVLYIKFGVLIIIYKVKCDKQCALNDTSNAQNHHHESSYHIDKKGSSCSMKEIY